MVLPASHGISRVPWYSGYQCRASAILFAYGAVTLCGAPSQKLWLNMTFLTDRVVRNRLQHCPTTPPLQRLRAITQRWFGLFPVRSPLLGESHLLSVPPGTEMVHFPGLATPPYVFRWRSRGFTSRGCPIRRSPGQSLFATHRSFSQLTASFVAVLRQGIHRTPLVA
jgi:hypothetical protein